MWLCVQPPLFPEMPVCRTCEHLLGRNEYRIMKRRATKGRRFCSMDCVVAYLSDNRPKWTVTDVRMSGPDPMTGIFQHAVTIQPKTTVKYFESEKRVPLVRTL